MTHQKNIFLLALINRRSFLWESTTFMKSDYDPSIREVLNNEDWEAVLPKVLKYARAQSKNMAWLGFKVEDEELVNEAIARAYGVGQNKTYRNWNREKCPDLSMFLKGIIKSIISHRVEHANSYPEDSLYHNEGTQKTLTLRKDLKGDAHSFRLKNPEKIFAEKEDLGLLVDKLKEVASGDEKLEYVIMCLEDGINRPREIAEVTGYDVKEVYKSLNMLRRRLKKLTLN